MPTRSNLVTWMTAGLLTGVALLAGGCAAGPGGSSPALVDPDRPNLVARIAPADYGAAFDTARKTLRDRGFILERVDAAEGVITSQAKTTAGLATPWDREQQSFGQEIEDVLERQQRIVRVSFEPTDGTTPAPGTDLRTLAGPLTMRVVVVLQRVNVPGRKLEPEAIGQSSYSWDPALADRGMQPTYAVSARRDEALEETLTREIAAGTRSETVWVKPHRLESGS